MIIWINGAFGAGKTTIAKKLQEKINNSYLYDPENLGAFFMNNLPPALQFHDFQDYLEWRQWNTAMLLKLNREFSGTIIVPMSLYKKEYFEEIVGGLRGGGVNLKHFVLEVSKQELIHRLELREKSSSIPAAWGLSKLAEALEFYEKIKDSEKVNNENGTVDEVVANILRMLRED